MRLPKFVATDPDDCGLSETRKKRESPRIIDFDDIDRWIDRT